MSVTPIGNANFINQNAPVVSSVNASQQARFDMQNALAMQVAADDNNEITEIRPTEETYKIDPENEHEKSKSDQEQAAMQNENEASNNSPEAKSEQIQEIFYDEDGEPTHIDIKI
ncbi:hypothetical protein [Campylobacter suis]|uniref:Uncharacterized protein n=1 Tax=Campylobacter suis TaxID=2790657 RepID=A0ABN7K8D3_9BACT|nr:hypothetical protein [Campylobacter suis]CAD7288695.1 hypothetical protein LMG8286_01463 [Campylobacter suis]